MLMIETMPSVPCIPTWCGDLHRVDPVVAVVRQFFRGGGGSNTESSFVVARERGDKVVALAKKLRSSKFETENNRNPVSVTKHKSHQKPRSKVLLPMFPAAAMKRCPPSLALCTADSSAKL